MAKSAVIFLLSLLLHLSEAHSLYHGSNHHGSNHHASSYHGSNHLASSYYDSQHRLFSDLDSIVSRLCDELTSSDCVRALGQYTQHGDITANNDDVMREKKRSRALSLDTALRLIPLQQYSSTGDKMSSAKSKLDLLG